MTLVVDVGAVNTVGMADGRPVTVDGAPWLPSVVHGGLVGADAVLLGGAVPNLAARFDPAVVRALVGRVVTAARGQGGHVGQVVVTHPASWRPERVAGLAAAAGPGSWTLAEPVAVAAGHGVGEGETVLVVDAGGGTWDVAAVRRTAEGYRVVAQDALPFGGIRLDHRIVERVRPSLRTPPDAALWQSARTAKEQLSRHETTEVVLPDHRAVRLDRAEFERLVATDVDRLAALAATVAAAVRGRWPARRRGGVRRVLLAGGTSRVPLLRRRLAEVTGRAVVIDPEPETAVVRGAFALL
jgi:molecular chaperone DnaK (HSP70)